MSAVDSDLIFRCAWPCHLQKQLAKERANNEEWIKQVRPVRTLCPTTICTLSHLGLLLVESSQPPELLTREQIIEKYDAARHGGVTFAELTEILTELSGGSGPKDHPTEPEVFACYV